jgi:hypothetical protein
MLKKKKKPPLSGGKLQLIKPGLKLDKKKRMRDFGKVEWLKNRTTLIKQRF